MLRTVCIALRRGRRRLPREIAALPVPSLRGGWGNIERMSEADRREVVGGAWRRETPVQLLPSAADRDAGGFVDGVRFASDEEAEAFIAQETLDDGAELGIPALRLARDFFEELAQAADSEVDMEGVMEATTTSDAEREEEERNFNYRFFADFYVQQGIICNQERQQFVRSMLQPPVSMVMINPGMPFVRLMMRFQLERHLKHTQAGIDDVVFLPHAVHPLLYVLRAVLTSGFGDLRELFPQTQGPAVVVGQDMKKELISHPTGDSVSMTSFLPDSEGENMRGFIMDDQVEPFLNNDDSVTKDDITASNTQLREHTVAEVKEDDKSCAGPAVHDVLYDRATDLAVMKTHYQIPRAMLSIGYVYWLQRQVAADTLIEMDPLGVMLPSMISFFLAAGSAGIILDMSSRSGTEKYYSYGSDIASYFGTSCHTGIDEGKCVSNVVTISLLSPGVKEEKTLRRPMGQHSAKATVKDVLPDWSATGDDQGHTADYYHVGNESRITARGSCRRVWGALRGSCNVVICCPTTTADGRRPRSFLGSGDVSGQFFSAGNGGKKNENEGEAAACRFVSICTRVNKIFPGLRRELAQALEYVRPRGGRVVYATHSMNPLENEAVVCSVLTDFKRRYPERVYRPVFLTDRQSDDDAALLHSFMAGGRHGVETWVSLQDCPIEQERSYCDDEVVSSVALHSWRASPLNTGTDLCFVCVIEFGEGCTKSTVLSPHVESSIVASPAISPPFLHQWLDTERLRKCWGFVIQWNSDKSAFFAVTTAVLRVMDAISVAKHAHDYSIVDYGVCIGTSFARFQDRSGDGIVSSSLSGTLLALALCESIREECCSFYVLELPVEVVLELLHTRCMVSRRLNELHVYFSAWLDSVVNDDGIQTVFLRVSPPKAYDPGLCDMELHEAIADELRKLVVVAQAHVHCHKPTEAKKVVLKIECATKCGQKQLEERVLAISDALRYMLRQLGYPAAAWGQCGGRPRLEDDEYEPAPHSQPLPPPAGDTCSLLGRRADEEHGRRLRRLGNVLRSLGVHGDGGPMNDWVRELGHRSSGTRKDFSLSFLHES